MLKLDLHPFPVLTSNRLIFRELVDEDIQEVFLLRSDPEVMKYIPRPLVTTMEEALEHINMIRQKKSEKDAINWAISEKDSAKLIGIIGFYRTQHAHFRSEIGYMLLPEYQNKGYSSEAVKRVLHFGFHELHLHSVNAVIAPENIPSEKVLLKNGFRKEAHFVQDFFWKDQFLDSAHYGLLKSEFVKKDS